MSDKIRSMVAQHSRIQALLDHHPSYGQFRDVTALKRNERPGGIRSNKDLFAKQQPNAEALARSASKCFIYKNIDYYPEEVREGLAARVRKTQYSTPRAK